ncbi:alpha/beta hydrolase-fold protein [Undibacterium fentianense]|uniref:Esterase n=1 Tax=Undibacterium fentianense TaxID=2828728 RepID=A0A941IFW4_9BURK|nr:alpha/beta hydrolase-fold protein [Undibacterium fentianense]MBR7799425.1 hypothetical protein [Undibacterium fentianense]
MKKLLILTALLCVVPFLHAQEQNPLVIGFEVNSQSVMLQAERKFWVHLPDGYQRNTVQRYPVIYVLDGDSQFRSLVAITEHLSELRLIPKMIVVGIIQGDRMVDLTFGKDKEYSGASGGGDQFLDYIEKELVPYVDLTYRTAPYRTFVGHSVGGLTVVHGLVHRPQLFQNYISLEGALWWNGHQIVKDAKSRMATSSLAGKTLFLAIANHMEKPVSLKQLRYDKTSSSDLARANLELSDEIAKHKNLNLRLVQRYYPEDNHNSVTLQGQIDALRFIFDFYPLKMGEKDRDNLRFDIVRHFSAHYRDLSMKMGYTVRPESDELVNLGYMFLNRKQFDKSEYFFQQLVSNYPSDSNSYDCLGDLYLAKGDKSKAIESFQRALEFGEMKETREKLNALLNQQ